MSEWKTIPGFPEYEICEDGTVRRLVARAWVRAGSVLKPRVQNSGYLEVKLRKFGVYHHRLIHRLVCHAFNGAPPQPDMHACHRDGIKTNNHHSNLRWDTREGNEADKEQHGTRLRGLAHPHARFSATDVGRMRDQKRCGASTADIIQLFCVSPQHLSQICSGKKRVAG